MRLIALMCTVPLLGGCVVATVAKTAVDVATLPVKVVSAGVDAATTSQAEADQKRGREMREAEERRGRELRKMEQRCRAGRPLPTDDCRLFERR
ncbi:MAG TPA: hypothetical protein VM265_03500 [Sphingomicrobium sp.]|nr:hypothetical protein [Sphingomicrobium sp.]